MWCRRKCYLVGWVAGEEKRKIFILRWQGCVGYKMCLVVWWCGFFVFFRFVYLFLGVTFDWCKRDRFPDKMARFGIVRVLSRVCVQGLLASLRGKGGREKEGAGGGVGQGRRSSWKRIAGGGGASDCSLLSSLWDRCWGSGKTRAGCWRLVVLGDSGWSAGFKLLCVVEN